MNFAIRHLIAAPVFMMLISAYAQANQFQHQTAAGYDIFRFEWLDYSQKPMALELGFRSEFTQHVINDPKMQVHADQVGQEIFNTVKRHALSLSDDHYSLEVNQEPDGINVSGTGVNQSELERRLGIVQGAQEQVINDLRANSYLWISDEGDISFNYQRMVHDALPMMSQILRNWPQQLSDQRHAANSFLSFLQAIPYDSLEKSTDFGVLTPAAMLALQRGDCETKQVALATFLKSKFPGLSVILVGTGNHMLLGALIEPQGGDSLYRYKGHDYVLMDATGPARAPAGRIDKNSRDHLTNEFASVFEI